MCGILGRISKNEISRDDFRKNLSKLDHRGPDDSGTYFLGENLALGQTRLSIIDLSKDGHQPMFSPCRKYVIIFNGEIYNYEEIKNNLIDKGYKFFSTSDTEVILNGFIEYGSDIVGMLNGMFAFAVYSFSERTLFLARDRSGIKPLYYRQDDSDFIFSSEIRTLKNDESEIDINSKVLCLTLGYVPEPLTIYKNIKMFPAGHYGVFKDFTLSLRRFKRYEFAPKIDTDYSSIVSETHRLLHNSVKRHLISDAPIGTFLSGGLDSSALTAIAAQYREQLNTLSLIFDEKKYSEESYQDMVVERYKTKHTKYLISEEFFLNSIKDFFNSIDQPTIDGLNTFLVSKAAHEVGLKTVLSGLGGDEIFYGYPAHKLYDRIRHSRHLPKSTLMHLSKIRKLVKLKFLNLNSDIRNYLVVRGVFFPEQIATILNMDLTEVTKIINGFFSEYYLENNLNTPKDQVGQYELELYMRNQLLRDSDVFGMANSLEIRVPFLDSELVDYVLRIPPKFKFDKKINKKILADAVGSELPNELFTRPKMGFTMPFDVWIRANIDEFGFNDKFKKQFMNRELHWSRIWLLYTLNRFS